MFKKILLLFLLSFSYTFSQTGESSKVDVEAFARLKDGRDVFVVNVTVEEYLNTKYYSLLNYIFFEDDSYKIPSRYKLLKTPEATQRFNPESDFLNYEVLDVYYNLLNILGQRLKKDPNKKLTLVGCNSDKGIETGNLTLSKSRAESIRNYICQTWGIEESRIKIEARNLPAKSSKSKLNSGVSDEENRRVEIWEDNVIISPLVINDTTRTSNPPTIIFKTKANINEKIKDWRISILQNNKNLKNPPFRGTGEPPKEKVWPLNKEKKEMPTTDNPIIYNIDVNSSFRLTSPNKKIPVEQLTTSVKKKLKLKNKEYSRYNLLLFDFDSFSVDSNNLSILKIITKSEEIHNNTKIYITGYTDTTGSLEYNRKLSTDRANETANQLSHLGIDKNLMIVDGVGSTNNPYFVSAIDKMVVREGAFMDRDEIDTKNDNNIINFNNYPEGRFYCRTVVIEIEKTSVENK